MADPYLGEIKIVSFGFAMKGWALCNGQLLPISQNQALYSLLGTTYGGDGRTTFGLPNLMGRAPAHRATEIQLGQLGGEESHVLNSAELPAHVHQAQGTTNGPSAGNPAGSVWATLTATQNPYSPTPNAQMAAAAIQPTGGGQPHPNLQPYLVLNFVIAVAGIYPSRN